MEKIVVRIYSSFVIWKKMIIYIFRMTCFYGLEKESFHKENKVLTLLFFERKRAKLCFKKYGVGKD